MLECMAAGVGLRSRRVAIQTGDCQNARGYKSWNLGVAGGCIERAPVEVMLHEGRLKSLSHRLCFPINGEIGMQAVQGELRICDAEHLFQLLIGGIADAELISLCFQISAVARSLQLIHRLLIQLESDAHMQLCIIGQRPFDRSM